MAETKSKKSADKFFDVAKPGKTAPSSTARPVIITNRPVLKDPMVIRVNSGDEPDDDSSNQAAPAASTELSHKVDIKPLHIDLSDVLPAKKSKKDEADQPAEPAAEEPEKAGEPEEPEKETPPADEKPAETPSAPPLAKKIVEVKVEKAETESVESPAAPAAKTTGEKVIAPPEHDAQEPAQTPAEEPSTPAPASEPTPEEPDAAPEPAESIPADEPSLTPADDEPSLDNSDRPVLSEKEAKAAEAAKKVADEQAKIIASGQYLLPINAVSQRRTKRNVAIMLVVFVLLLAVAALAAWDAELISIPHYSAPTNFL